MDEPLAGLDEKTQDMLLEFLQSFHKAGKTLITITHNRQLAETIGNRFAVMNEEHELKMIIKKVLPAELEVLFLLWVECASIVEVCALYSVVTQVLCVVYILTK